MIVTRRTSKMLVSRMKDAREYLSFDVSDTIFFRICLINTLYEMPLIESECF